MRRVGLFLIIYIQLLLRHLLKVWYLFPIICANARCCCLGYHELLAHPIFHEKAFLCLLADLIARITDRIT